MNDTVLCDGYTTIGSTRLELIKLGQFDSMKISGNPRHFFSYCGGSIIIPYSIDTQYLSFCSNNGKEQYSSRFVEGKDAYSIFGLQNGYICFISNRGNITVVDKHDNIITNAQSNENNMILCSNISRHGITYVSQETLILFYRSFGTQTPKFFSYQLNIQCNPKDVAILDDYLYQFIILTQSNDLYLSSFENQVPVLIKHIPEDVRKLYVPFKGSTIAVVSDSSLYFVSIDNKKSIEHRNFKNIGTLGCCGWVTDDVFAYTLNNKLNLTVPNSNKSITLNVNQIIDLFEDFDCIRIYTSNNYYILRSVPETVKALDSNKSYGKLSLSYEMFLRRNIDSYNILKGLIGSIEIAVDVLLAAAQDTLNIQKQKYLLNLASYGRKYCGSKGGEQYSQTLQKLRLINTLNSSQFAFAITSKMFTENLDEVFNACLERNQYKLAISICDICSKRKESVIEQWAVDMFYKFRDSATQKVLSRCSKYENINFKFIGESVKKINLKFETIFQIAHRIVVPKERIQFMFSYDKAASLNMALETFDGDALLTYLMYLDSSERETFIKEIFTKKQENNRRFAQQYMSFKIYNLIEQQNQFKLNNIQGLGQYMNDIILQKPYSTATNLLLYSSPQQKFSSISQEVEIKKAFEKTPFNFAFDQQNKLLSKKKKLNLDLPQNLTPRQLLNHTIITKDNKLLKEVVREFGFSERAVAYAKMNIYIQKRMFNELNDFTRVPSPVIKWKDFAVACIENGLFEQATKFMNLVKEEDTRKVLNSMMNDYKSQIFNQN